MSEPAKCQYVVWAGSYLDPPEFGDPRLPERFWKKVRLAPSGCWEWRRVTHSAGYGTFTLNYVKHYAHRFAYEALVGPIPDGLVIDHLCCNRRCCNVAHLEPVTIKENVTRAFRDRETCSQGHAWTDENTYRNPSNGHRRCRTCMRERDRRRAPRCRSSVRS